MPTALISPHFVHRASCKLRFSILHLDPAYSHLTFLHLGAWFLRPFSVIYFLLVARLYPSGGLWWTTVSTLHIGRVLRGTSEDSITTRLHLFSHSPVSFPTPDTVSFQPAWTLSSLSSSSTSTISRVSYPTRASLLGPASLFKEATLLQAKPVTTQALHFLRRLSFQHRFHLCPISNLPILASTRFPLSPAPASFLGNSWCT